MSNVMDRYTQSKQEGQMKETLGPKGVNESLMLNSKL